MEQTQRLEAGQEATNGFGETSLVRVAETSAIALAEQAKAAVHARYVMAMQRPRDLQVARQKLLTDCKRTRFAETAIYHKPVGEGVEGPSIRFAEAAARAMGNVLVEVSAIYDDAQKRIVRVSVTDLESNITYPKDVTIEKTIERSKALPGRKILGTRKNSKGYDVFLIEATSEEILDKENALCSKAMRTCLLRIVPGDLLDEAIEQCYETRRSDIAQDPTRARKKLVDAFQELGISASQLVDYFGHPLDSVTAEEIDSARSVYSALKDKEATWSEVLEAARTKRGASEPAGPLDEPITGSVSNRMAAKAAATQEKAPAREVEVEKTTSETPNVGKKKQSRFQE